MSGAPAGRHRATMISSVLSHLRPRDACARAVGVGSDGSSTSRLTADGRTSPAAVGVRSNPARWAEEFACRGLVVLAPEDLGVPAELHRTVFEKEKAAVADTLHTPPGGFILSRVPEVVQVINSPGVVAACDQLVGKGWAIVPFCHHATFASGGRDQHWHKDDNSPYNGRKQRHHHPVQLEMLYYPQAVSRDMGPTATVPFSQYWTFNHETNHDNFATDHLDFNFQIEGMERVMVSGPDAAYGREEIEGRTTAHDKRHAAALTETGWPITRAFEAAPLAAGSVVLYSHNLFHRGNHRVDPPDEWAARPRFMWRFWLYRTTNPDPSAADERAAARPLEIPEVDPLTGTALGGGALSDDVTEVWRQQHHWLRTGRPAPPRAASVRMGHAARREEAACLAAQLELALDAAEPQRVGAAYKLASLAEPPLALAALGAALRSERESVRRAAIYGLVAMGPGGGLDAVLLDAARSAVAFVRRAAVFGLGDAAVPSLAVCAALRERLAADPSVYVRAVAAGALGCLGRRAAGAPQNRRTSNDPGGSAAAAASAPILQAAIHALVCRVGDLREMLFDVVCGLRQVACLAREPNRLSPDRVQGRSIKFVRPTDDADVCEGMGMDYGLAERFAPVRSAVRENALWSPVILATRGPRAGT
jgi:ectoine hydroxylase-related dioxygenase (phytanoyl-CoA dioxygenase family)